MPKRMTVVFDDEKLYTAVKVEAARSGRHAKDIVAEALQSWLEDKELAEDLEGLEEIREEWRREGGVEAGEYLAGLESRRARAVRKMPSKK